MVQKTVDMAHPCTHSFLRPVAVASEVVDERGTLEVVDERGMLVVEVANEEMNDFGIEVEEIGVGIEVVHNENIEVG